MPVGAARWSRSRPYSSAVVISTPASQCSRMYAVSSALSRSPMATRVAPARMHATSASTYSRQFGSQTATGRPRPAPRTTLARRPERSASSP